MSADDEDDWANESFIATIENVVKKAEEASAARHGGTQFVAPTPRCPTIIPPKTTASLLIEASTSIHGTPLLYESLVPRPSNGSTAPPPRDTYADSAFRHGEHVNLEQKWTSSFGTPHRPGQPKFALQSVSHQRPSSLAEVVPKGVHSPHQSSQRVLWGAQPAGGLVGVREESVPYEELLAEKDGAISLLRSRLKQAELQVDELHKRVGPQSASHPSLFQQQRELERLSSQLLFKDHEVTEAQRNCAQKEEQLKAAVTETVALKEEIAQLRKSRQTGAECQRPWDEGTVEVAEKNSESYGAAPAVPHHVSVRKRAGVSNQNLDPWSPPWIPEGSSKGAQGKTAAEFPGKILKDAAEVGGYQRLQAESSIIQALKSRTGGNGCVPSDGKHFLQGDTGQANELLRSDMPRLADASMSVRANAAGSGASQGLNSLSRTSELYYSLQQLWGLKGARNDGMSLLSKLYANCRQHLYILLSHGQSPGALSLTSPHTQKEKKTESGTVSQKLHMALAKVANGSAHHAMIITPLLEFCKLDNVDLTGNALHVLHCILDHDSTCRQKLLLRGNQGGSDPLVHSMASRETVDKLEKSGEGKGWFIASVPKGSITSQIRPLPVFSSPRILCRPRVEDNLVKLASGKRDETGGYERGHESPRPSGKTHQQAQEHEVTGAKDTSVPVEDLNPLMKWMLHLALTTSSPNVKFEAVAIIGALVVKSEPLVERVMFGPLLCHGGMDLLLKESAGAEIQLQAVRIVHLLLHFEVDQAVTCQPKHVNERDPADAIHVEKRAKTLLPGDGHNDENVEKSKTAVNLAPQQSSCPQLSKAKLLEGMTECLKHNGNSLQGQALHRSVIKLLTFIATSGDFGAASLLQMGTSHEDPELGQTCKDDSKTEGILGGENASGQRIIGSGSGSTHLKGLDLGDRGSGIPVSLVNESVEDLERGKNIPQRLVALIDLELDIDEREGWNEPNIADERDRLIHEAATLLCHLSLHAVQSPIVLGQLISNKDMARLTLSVTNRLVTRKSHSQQPGARERPATRKNSDIAELARGLRTQVLNSLAESGQSL